MSVFELLTDFVMPIGGSMLLAVGLVSWQRHGFLPGLLIRPRRWEAVVLLIGAAVMTGYAAFVVHYDSAVQRFVTVLCIVLLDAVVAWLASSRVLRLAPNRPAKTSPHNLRNILPLKGDSHMRVAGKDTPNA